MRYINSVERLKHTFPAQTTAWDKTPICHLKALDRNTKDMKKDSSSRPSRRAFGERILHIRHQSTLLEQTVKVAFYRR